MSNSSDGPHDDWTGEDPADAEPFERQRHAAHAPREVAFHLTLSEEDRELLDTLAHRMNCSRTETIARALHLLEAVQGQVTRQEQAPTEPKEA